VSKASNTPIKRRTLRRFFYGFGLLSLLEVALVLVGVIWYAK